MAGQASLADAAQPLVRLDDDEEPVARLDVDDERLDRGDLHQEDLTRVQRRRPARGCVGELEIYGSESCTARLTTFARGQVDSRSASW
jgi:hypothetical protein